MANGEQSLNELVRQQFQNPSASQQAVEKALENVSTDTIIRVIEALDQCVVPRLWSPYSALDSRAIVAENVESGRWLLLSQMKIAVSNRNT